MEPKRSWSLGPWILAIAVLGVASGAHAQHIGSVYLDAVADSSALYTIVNTSDGSTDCEHGGHSTLAWLNGPTGYSGSWQGGFDHGVSLPLADGDFTEGGAIAWTCGCWGAYQSADSTQGLKITTTYYSKDAFEYPTVCYYTPLACTSGNPSCTTNTPLAITNAPKPCASHRAVVFLVIASNCFEAGSFGTGSGGACT